MFDFGFFFSLNYGMANYQKPFDLSRFFAQQDLYKKKRENEDAIDAKTSKEVGRIIFEEELEHRLRKLILLTIVFDVIVDSIKNSDVFCFIGFKL